MALFLCEGGLCNKPPRECLTPVVFITQSCLTLCDPVALIFFSVRTTVLTILRQLSLKQFLPPLSFSTHCQLYLLLFFLILSFFFPFGHAAWHMGFYFPKMGYNLLPLHWKYKILITGSLRKSLLALSKITAIILLFSVRSSRLYSP